MDKLTKLLKKTAAAVNSLVFVSFFLGYSNLEKKKIYKDLKLKESNLIGKIEDLEQKNSLLTDNLDLDFIEILIREKFLFGKTGETTYIIDNENNQN